MEPVTHLVLLLVVKILTFSINLYLLVRTCFIAYKQISQEGLTQATKKLWFLIGLIIFCELFENASWILKLGRKIFFPDSEPYLVLWFLRMTWGLNCLEYLSLGFLIERLIVQRFTFKIRHFINSAICCVVVLYSTFIAFQFHPVPTSRTLETVLYKFINVYILYLLFSMLLFAIKSLYGKKLPKILQHQLKILISLLLAPHFLLSLIALNPFMFSRLQDFLVSDTYIFVALSSLFFTIALYFCSRKMLGLRFLNVTNHVQALEKYNFINDFKSTLEQLGYVSNIQELQRITKSFFHQAFTVEPENIQLYLREIESFPKATPQEEIFSYSDPTATVHASPAIEQELTSQDNQKNPILSYLMQHRILIRDEIEFDYFYASDQLQQQLIQLLDNADAHIFLPLYEKQNIVAYIIIRQNTRPKTLFSNVERDEMLVFASYLSTIIYFLRHRNIKTLIQHEKELKEELYFKHQEIHHYKESIRTLLKTHSTQKIAIVYCKNRSLFCSNSFAMELLYNKNSKTMEPHYELALKKLAADVKKYGADRKIHLKDIHGNDLICTASLSMDKSQVLLLIFYPHIADTFTIPFDTLKDLSSWDYAVYLETTKSGQLINQLIPSSSEAMLNFKIELLKVAFSREATLIDLPDQDILPVVKIMHHISLRTVLHTISLASMEQNQAVGLQLCGIDPLFAASPQEESLLEKLSDTGTIFIQNVEFLSLETQERLLAYLQSGMYQPLKSDRKKYSSARLIFSTSNNLELLTQQGLFSAELLKKLKKNRLALPSLLTIPPQELTELAQRFSEQALKSKEFNALISLDEKETHKLINQRPTSLYEFKERVQSALITKSTKQKIDHMIEFNPSYTTDEPEIAHAIRLGKHALKDKYLMRLLWNKFQNQTKIATLLNVNRSSVNRRCKEFQLVGEHE